MRTASIKRRRLPISSMMRARFLEHVHLQDADGYADRHWHPGEGTIPWGGVFKALRDIDANPRLIIEVHYNLDKLPETVKRLEDRGLAQ